MADRLYLSLWYPNFRLESLPAALSGVLRQFAMVGGKRVTAASAYPINFTEPPSYQRIYIGDDHPAQFEAQFASQFDPLAQINPDPDAAAALIDAAVAEATEQMHDDMAYEFEMRWQLWVPQGRDAGYNSSLAPARDADRDDTDAYPDIEAPALGQPDDSWMLRAQTVRILGFGPQFDLAGFEQNGHLLVDFGIDTPWVPTPPPESSDDASLDETTQIHIQQNVEKLLAFTLLVEKNCGISSRLLWTESGEPLAEKLIARLQRVH